LALYVATGAFGLALTVIVGGAVYSTVQVNGIQQRAEQAAQDIREKSADFEKQLSENAKEIQDKTSHIDDIIKNIVTSDKEDFGKVLKSAQDDLNGYVTGTKSKLDEAQTKVVADINGELRDHVQVALTQITTNINAEGQKILTSWTDLDKKISDQASTASTAVNQAKENAIKLLNGPTTEVDAAKGMAISAVQKTQTEATNELQNYAAQAAGKRDETIRNIGKMQDDVSAREQSALQQVNAELAKLPERTTGLVNAVAAVDDALKDYRVDMARILTDLSAQQPQTSLGRVVLVLGASFWLVLGSLAVSMLALLISLLGLWRRPRGPRTKPAVP
jgi:hypothetical protein